MSPKGYPKAARHPEPEVKEEQCLYCSLYFQDVAAHQRLVHKGERPTDRPPETPGGMGPGEIFHPLAQPGQVAPPAYKNPWSQQWIEWGYECGDTGCRHRTIYKGDKTPPNLPDYLPDPCPRCGTMMKRMFDWVECEPLKNERITWNGVSYDLIGERVNLVPSCIKNEIEQRKREARRGMVRQDSDRAVGAVRRLETVGFLPPVEEDTTY